jgi:hypothetical protein
MKHIDFEMAKRIASNAVHKFEIEISEALCLLDEQTIEFDMGWIFFYNSVSFVETGDEVYRLAGNGPLFVDRAGCLHILPSALPWQKAVDQILNCGGPDAP